MKKIITASALFIALSNPLVSALTIDYDGSVLPSTSPYFRTINEVWMSTDGNVLTVPTINDNGLFFGSIEGSGYDAGWDFGSATYGRIEIKLNDVESSDLHIYIFDQNGYTARINFNPAGGYDNTVYPVQQGFECVTSTGATFYEADLTDAYHTFEFLVKGGQVSYRFDGQYLQTGAAAVNASRNTLVIGDITGSTPTGEGTMFVDSFHLDTATALEHSDWQPPYVEGMVASYLFDQSLTNSVGSGFALTEIGGSGSYVQDSVWGETKYVLSLSAAQGLVADMSAWRGSNDTYTIVMDVSLSNASSYQKLISFDAANASDSGLYTYFYDLTYFGGGLSEMNQDNIVANTWVRLAMTRSGNERTIYSGIPGSMQIAGSGVNTDNYALIGSLLTFLQNDSSQSGEDYPVKVSGIWISNTVLSETDLQSVDLTPVVSLEVASAYGSPVPAAGTNEVASGTVVTCSVDAVTSGSTNWSPIGWSMVGNEPFSGSTNWFVGTLTNDAVLTWNWETNYWLDLNVSGSGSVDVSDSWKTKDSEQTLTATPDAGWLFMGWSGDASGANATIGITIDAPKTITAIFSDDADGDGLTNSEEAGYGSNPWQSDTDGDGFNDAFEVAQGLNVTNDSSDVITYIENNGAVFDLYPSNVVLDVATGQLLIETSGSMATINLQLEKSQDLINWTNAGEAVEWNLSVDAEKKFFRIRAGE